MECHWVRCGRPDQASSQTTAFAKSVTFDQAKKIALKKVNGTIIEVDRGADDGEYEFEIRKGNYVYEVEVKKRTGKAYITEKEYKPVKKVKVTRAQAKAIALKKVPNGKVVKLKLDGNKYEVEIIKGKYEYEMDINASTGKILDYERDRRD
nr:PepSY domain-containing protein [Kurthia massiliensis]